MQIFEAIGIPIFVLLLIKTINFLFRIRCIFYLLYTAEISVISKKIELSLTAMQMSSEYFITFQFLFEMSTYITHGRILHPCV